MPRTSPPRRIETYSDALDLLIAFLVRTGMPRDIGALRREHIEAFLVSLQEAGRSPATVNNRYRSLQAFFRWLNDEDELGGHDAAFDMTLIVHG